MVAIGSSHDFRNVSMRGRLAGRSDAFGILYLQSICYNSRSMCYRIIELQKHMLQNRCIMLLLILMIVLIVFNRVKQLLLKYFHNITLLLPLTHDQFAPGWA